MSNEFFFFSYIKFMHLSLPLLRCAKLGGSTVQVRGNFIDVCVYVYGKAYKVSKNYARREKIKAGTRFTRVCEAHIKFQLKAKMCLSGCSYLEPQFHLRAPLSTFLRRRRFANSLVLLFLSWYHARMFPVIDPAQTLLLELPSRKSNFPLEKHRYLDYATSQS